MDTDDVQPGHRSDETVDLDLFPRQTGNHESALAGCQQADQSGDVNAPEAEGQILVEPGAVALAQAAYQRWLDAGDGRAGLWLGGLLDKANRFTEAHVAYRQAAELGDEHAKAVLEEIDQNPDPTNPSKRWQEVSSAFVATGARRISDIELVKEVSRNGSDRSQRLFIRWVLAPPALEVVRIYSPFVRLDQAADLRSLVARVGQLSAGSLGYVDFQGQTSGEIEGLLTIELCLPLSSLEAGRTSDLIPFMDAIAAAAHHLETECSDSDAFLTSQDGATGLR